MLAQPLLTVIFLLSIGFFYALIIPAQRIALIRQLCLLVSLAALFVGVFACLAFDKGAAGYQFMSSFNLITDYNLSFALGVDGLSLVFLMLTLFTFPAMFLAA
jgi:NADH-quinone oxidoreductase subunit M